MTLPPTVLFLPGASGNTAFWKPVATRLAVRGDTVHVAWPGLGGAPTREDVCSFDDLVRIVTDVIDAEPRAPVDIVAQSMGSVVALHAALARGPRIRRLVLVATSGGVDVVRLGGIDWRAQAAEWQPSAAPDWFLAERRDISDRLWAIVAPTLLISGEFDPLSPPAVSDRLRQLLPSAEVLVVSGADHDVALSHVDVVAGAVQRHLSRLPG